MIPNEIRTKLQDIIHGTRFEGTEDRCTTVRNLLIEGFGTNSTVKAAFQGRAVVKEKQAEYLKSWAKDLDSFLDAMPMGSAYLTNGGECYI